MVKSSFYTNIQGDKWECVGSVFWAGKEGEEPWKRDNGVSFHVKKGYGRVDDYSEHERGGEHERAHGKNRGHGSPGLRGKRNALTAHRITQGRGQA